MNLNVGGPGKVRDLLTGAAVGEGSRLRLPLGRGETRVLVVEPP